MLATGGIVCYLRNINRFLPTLRRGKGGRNAAVDILPVSQRFLSGVVDRMRGIRIMISSITARDRLLNGRSSQLCNT